MGPWQSYIELAYKDWLKTQDNSYQSESPYCHSWLLNYEEFYNNRAPGNTCLPALRRKECGRRQGNTSGNK